MVWGAILLGAATVYVFLTLDSQGLFRIPERKPGIMVVAADGQVIAERGSFFGDEARLSELPRFVPQAVIAIEDRRFYHHFGIDPIGLARAVITNLRAGRVVQGGSTLTQQLAKNLFLKPERTLRRKLQEAVLAIWLESRFTKDEILQLYLNRVYFGAGAWGIEKAAQKYFGKSARDLNLGEAAILAGLLKAPARYNPLRHPERARRRAREVIRAMVEEGYISSEEARRALSRVRPVRAAGYVPATQYIVDWILEQLPDLIGEFDRSIVVETTLDHALQQRAERVLRRTLRKEGSRRRVSQGAIVVLDPKGAVRAMVGGVSYRRSQFNRAVHAQRQPGSAFKPFVYLTAVEQGYTPDSVELDAPFRIGDYQPENYGKKYYGRVTLRTALAKSLNTVAVKLCVAVGPENVVATAHRLGISSPLNPVPALALGVSEVNLLELTAAYAPFANGGKAVVPYIVTRITSRDGKVLYERRGSGLGQVIGERELGMMNDMMRAVVETGTGRAARIPGREIGGKTGTSQDYRDAWFIGYAPQLIMGVWLGNDDNSPTRRVTGGSLPARIWKAVMEPALRKLPPEPLPGTYDNEEWSEPLPWEQQRVARQGGIIDFLTGLFGGGRQQPSPRPAPPSAAPAAPPPGYRPPPRRIQNFGPDGRRRIQNFGPARR
jgi:penicillin-binding protein 1A